MQEKEPVDSESDPYFIVLVCSDSIEPRLQKLITRASSTVFANIAFDTLDELDNAEVCLIF